MSWQIIEHENRNQNSDPEKIKEIVAAYFEDSYAQELTQHHPYQAIVEEKINELTKDDYVTNKKRSQRS